ncbi:MAG: hypothetical protein SWK76_09865 [Actinomycetota bacterium]|nr:hypothetical protein [Actinomycetota bacterium]
MFADSIEGMPVEQSMEMLSGSVARIDGRELGEAANPLLSVPIRLYEENPELLTREKMGVISEAVDTLDFGKLRKALMYRLQASQGYVSDEVHCRATCPSPS